MDSSSFVNQNSKHLQQADSTNHQWKKKRQRGQPLSISSQQESTSSYLPNLLFPTNPKVLPPTNAMDCANFCKRFHHSESNGCFCCSAEEDSGIINGCWMVITTIKSSAGQQQQNRRHILAARESHQ